MESYMEYMVKKRSTPKDLAIRYGCVALIVLVTVAAFLFYPYLALLIGIGLGCLYRYLIYPMTDLEYEYLYCDKQITVSRIMAKEKRKDLEVFDLDKVELLAPSNSYRLGDFKNRQLKLSEYWSQDKEKEEPPYAMIYEGGRKILLDLPKDFVKIIQNNAPRKVFFD
ncbi:MAG: hypothetical protein IK115_00350 [Lachnospiraceae bacterium]|nr:hypothetical protein [Lachnospiraceae bacterium]